MIEKQIEIINKLGLHARAAAKLVATTSAFSSDIRIKQGSQQVDAKSIMSVMLLAASRGTVLDFEFEGSDEQAAEQAISALIARRFDEES